MGGHGQWVSRDHSRALLLLLLLSLLSLLLLLYACTSSWELELRTANTVRAGGLVSKQMAQVRSYQRNKQTKIV